MIRKAYGELDDLVKELSFKWLKEMNLGDEKISEQGGKDLY